MLNTNSDFKNYDFYSIEIKFNYYENKCVRY